MNLILFLLGFFILVKLFQEILFVWQQNKDKQLLETVTVVNRGEKSERNVIIKLLKMGIDRRTIFHDCYLRRGSGSYTQIDIIVATKAGLITFEIKDYSGWIFGDLKQKYWTQMLAYGRKKYRFYNPVMQSNGHILALRENLPHNSLIPIFSIVVFYGNCKLKNVHISSDNVFIIYPSEIQNTVNSILYSPNANYGDKREIMAVLTQAVKNGTVREIISAQRNNAIQSSVNRPHSTYY